jgi:NADPH:quinone reductase-like Zn-dependent oxidoreductase
VVGVRRPRRSILGGYFAGEVVAVGDRVTGFAVGDAVYGGTGLRLGAYGEFLVVRGNAAVAPKPRTMSFVEAAAVPLGGLNAAHFLGRARVRPGERVLVNGAGGSIGAHAVQIARSMGAEVTGVDHPIKEELVRRLGAGEFVDYTREDVAAGGRRFDVVFDMVRSSPYRQLIGLLEPGGRYLHGNPPPGLLARAALIRRRTGKAVVVAPAPETRAALEAVTALVEAGHIGPIVDRVYPMSEVADAHRRVETEQRRGAVVLAIGRPGPDAATAHG